MAKLQIIQAHINKCIVQGTKMAAKQQGALFAANKKHWLVYAH